MSMKEVPRDAWKALATVGMWVAVGVCAICGVPEMKEVVGVTCFSTVILWLFG